VCLSDEFYLLKADNYTVLSGRVANPRDHSDPVYPVNIASKTVNKIGWLVPNNWTAGKLYDWLSLLSIINHRSIKKFPRGATKFQEISSISRMDFKFQ